jgi:hypothetical protein
MAAFQAALVVQERAVGDASGGGADGASSGAGQDGSHDGAAQTAGKGASRSSEGADGHSDLGTA